MSNKYIRFSENYKINKLIPITDSPHKHIKNKDNPYFISMMTYDQAQYDEFLKTKSLSGISGSKTNKIWFDFDSKEDLSLAFKDCNIAVQKLQELGIQEEAIRVSFTGSKGTSIIVETTNEYTIEQVKAFCFGIASELQTFDTSPYDHQRIFRLNFTKNEKTGLYKIPLTLEELKEANIDNIKATAKIDPTPEEIKDVNEYYQVSSFKIPEQYLNIQTIKPKLKEVKLMDNLDIDWSLKPKWLSNCKFAIQNGLFTRGQRSEPLLAMASTYKNQGYNKEITYRMLKGVAENQAQRNGNERYSDAELYNNIVTQVYKDTWNNGQYSCKNKENFLYEYCRSLGEHKCKHEEDKDLVVSTDGVHSLFTKYAHDFDKNVLFTGIDSLDKKMKLMVGTSNGLLAPPGVGKCLGIDTPILMYDGSIKMVQNVKVGDLLMGDDSTPRTVLSTVKGQDNLYKIKQNNGNDYVVNSEHIISLKGSNSIDPNSKYSHNNVIDINLQDYINKSDDFKKRMKGYKVPVQFQEKEVPLDPYFIGYWLGNGTSSKTQVTVHSEHTPVINYMNNFVLNYNYRTTTRQNSENSITIDLVNEKGSKNQILDGLRQLELIDNKHIPNVYLVNSRQNRLKLMAGLIDSDGYCDTRGNYEITQKNDKLSQDIVYLARSLGYKTTIEKVTKKFNDFEGVYNRINISFDDYTDLPVLLDYKRLGKIERQRFYDLTEIEVEALDFGDYYGFEIDGNKRFVLGDFTVTHNTSLSLSILNHNSLMGNKSIFFSYDMFHSALYMRMIQKHTRFEQEKIYDLFRRNDQKTIDIFKQINDNYKNVKFCFKSGQTPDEIEDTIRHVQDSTGEKVKLIIVDYNELVVNNMSDSTANSAMTAQRLRQIANEHEVCVLTLLQPSKHFSSPADEITNFNAAKGSSAITQSLTLMLGCSRPGFNPRQPEQDKFFNITCLKNRNGPLFSLDYGWHGLSGTINELSYEAEQELAELRKSKEEAKNGDSGGWD